MSYSHGARSTRNHFVEPPSFLDRIRPVAPRPVRAIATVVRGRAAAAVRALLGAYERESRRSSRRSLIIVLVRLIFSVPNALLLLWIGTLWWGERTVFRDSVKACSWETWESWPENSVPNRVTLIADPQLVDAHTYPGRPWPLSALTVFYSDLYLYRTYTLLQKDLRPDSTIFLGDLFDGGREWGTATSTSPVAEFKRYGNDVWMKEYRRFVKLFFDNWKLGGTTSAASPHGRKIFASLPGNHDLGFGNGIQLPVLERFRAYFGEGSRVDIIGNHTFVSVDSVSLSAMDQPDLATGGSASGGTDRSIIWKHVEDFLNNLQDLKGKAIKETLLLFKNDTEKYLSAHKVVDGDDPAKPTQLPAVSTGDFPTIVLTHVPFYRGEGAPCGPLRERHPPSSTDPPPEKDIPNAIPINRGYQYQNVLTEVVSKDIATKAGPITQIYSGDDHDYCEVTHREYNGAPKEITVKSMSLAMGVRRPGFQMVSLWNPIDPSTGKSTSPKSSPTLQNHLCLLPDQISIFVQYAYIIVLTLLVLLVRALALAFRGGGSDTTAYAPILPLTERHPDEHTSSATSASASSSSNSHNDGYFASRGTIFSSRNTSDSPVRDTVRGVRHVQVFGASGLSDARSSKSRDQLRLSRESPSPERDLPIRGFRRSLFILRQEVLVPMKKVGITAFLWYLWLVWTW